MKESKIKIISIIGPTASGKSDLAVSIAKQFNGEIISADSRQVYKRLDIGTGKITKGEMQDVRHHLLDVISAKKQFTVSDFVTYSEKAIKNIVSKNKLPIVCGGTGFYVDTLLSGLKLPEVPPNRALREKLSDKSITELMKILSKLDNRRAEEIDKNNKPRIIRAIEIAKAIGKVPKIKNKPKYTTLYLGINHSKDVLRQRISTRLQKRLKSGMISEVKNLHRDGLSWKRMEELGLEYRYISRYLRKLISKNQMIESLDNEINQYAKRQITWFKRNKDIIWINLEDLDSLTKTIQKFLK